MYNKMTDQALPESEEGMPYITDTSLSLIKLQRRREEKGGGLFCRGQKVLLHPETQIKDGKRNE